MFKASEAAEASKNALEAMTVDLKNKLQRVISAAIAQGSCKTSFYPRNAFELEKATVMLEEHGYKVDLRVAKDQRDEDCINITWG